WETVICGSSALRASEPQNEPGRAPGEIEPVRSLDDVDKVHGAERAKVPKVATHADVSPEEEHHATANVPCGFAVVEAQDIAERVDLGANHADAHQRRGTSADALLAAERNADQQIARRGQNAAATEVGLTEEVWTACDIRLETENPSAHIGQAHTPVEALRADRIRKLVPRLAAEVGANERDDHAIGSRRGRRHDSEQQAQCERSSE